MRSAEELAREAFYLGVSYYRRHIGRASHDPLARDLYWDATIDAMLKVIAKYDGKRALGKYFERIARSEWIDIYRYINALKRKDNGKYFQIEAQRDTGPDRIDGAELAPRVKAWLDAESYDIWMRYVSGETVASIGRSYNQKRNVMFYRVNNIRQTLKVMVEHAAPARAPE